MSSPNRSASTTRILALPFTRKIVGEQTLHNCDSVNHLIFSKTKQAAFLENPEFIRLSTMTLLKTSDAPNTEDPSFLGISSSMPIYHCAFWLPVLFYQKSIVPYLM
jgi:hypothetical protein